MLVGVLVLALPITILGSNFTQQYERMLELKNQSNEPDSMMEQENLPLLSQPLDYAGTTTFQRPVVPLNEGKEDQIIDNSDAGESDVQIFQSKSRPDGGWVEGKIFDTQADNSEAASDSDNSDAMNNLLMTSHGNGTGLLRTPVKKVTTTNTPVSTHGKGNKLKPNKTGGTSSSAASSTTVNPNLLMRIKMAESLIAVMYTNAAQMGITFDKNHAVHIQPMATHPMRGTNNVSAETAIAPITTLRISNVCTHAYHIDDIYI